MTMLRREHEVRDTILLASQKVTVPTCPSECENLDSLFKEYTHIHNINMYVYMKDRVSFKKKNTNLHYT